MHPADAEEFKKLVDQINDLRGELEETQRHLKQAQDRLSQNEKQFREIAQRANQAAAGMP